MEVRPESKVFVAEQKRSCIVSLSALFIDKNPLNRGGSTENSQRTLIVVSYLVHDDGDINDDIDKVSQCQAGYQCVRAVPHTLVLVNDPQQGGIPDHPNDENSAGYHGVNVFESFSNLSLLGAFDSVVGHRGLYGGEENAGFDPREGGKGVSRVTPIGSVSVRAVTEDKSRDQKQ